MPRTISNSEATRAALSIRSVEREDDEFSWTYSENLRPPRGGLEGRTPLRIAPARFLAGVRFDRDDKARHGFGVPNTEDPASSLGTTATELHRQLYE